VFTGTKEIGENRGSVWSLCYSRIEARNFSYVLMLHGLSHLACKMHSFIIIIIIIIITTTTTTNSSSSSSSSSGGCVNLVVKAIGYKPEGRGFKTR
jgi:hypothetical protein